MLIEPRDRSAHLPDRKRRERRVDLQRPLHRDVDDLVAQFGEVTALEVVPTLRHEARVEHRLVRQVRLHHAHVRDRTAEVPQRLDELLPLFRVAGPADDDHDDRLAVQLGRDDRQRRRLPVDDDRHQVIGRVRDPVPVEAQHVARLLHRPDDRPGQDLCAERNAVELELRDDPEVAAAATEAPE